MVVLLLNGVFISFFSGRYEGLLLFCCFFMIVDLSSAFDPGDIGLARIIDHDKSTVSTLTAGTMSYLLPEYLQYGKATDETDIFSYGVVVLELCCGLRPIEREPRGHKMNNLLAWVWELHSKSAICDAVDKRLNKEFDPNVREACLAGRAC